MWCYFPGGRALEVYRGGLSCLHYFNLLWREAGRNYLWLVSGFIEEVFFFLSKRVPIVAAHGRWCFLRRSREREVRSVVHFHLLTTRSLCRARRHKHCRRSKERLKKEKKVKLKYSDKNTILYLVVCLFSVAPFSVINSGVRVW